MPTDDSQKRRFNPLNDPAAVEIMRRDNESEYWKLCDELVRYCVDVNFSKYPGYPAHLKEEAVQESMSSLYRSLGTFRHECPFTSWIGTIVKHRVIDILRRHRTRAKREVYSDKQPESEEEKNQQTTVSSPQTPEEIALANEREKEVVREINAGIESFLQKSRNPELNRRILEVAFGENCNYKEIARKLNITVPEANIGYVVRAARKHLEDLLNRHKKASNMPENDAP